MKELVCEAEEQTAAMSQLTTAAQNLTKENEELTQLVAQFEIEK